MDESALEALNIFREIESVTFATGDIYRIEASLCLECGACLEACPEGAVEPAKGL